MLYNRNGTICLFGQKRKSTIGDGNTTRSSEILEWGDETINNYTLNGFHEEDHSHHPIPLMRNVLKNIDN